MLQVRVNLHWFKLLAALTGFLLITAFSAHGQSGDEAPSPPEEKPAAAEEKPPETVDQPGEKPPGDGLPAETVEKPPGDGLPAETAEKPPGDGQPAAADQKPPGDGQPAETAEKPPGDAEPVPPAAGLPKLAILQLHQSGVLDSEFGEIQTRLVGELKSSGKFELLTDTGMAQALSGLNLQPGECREPDCAAKIGLVLGADKVVVGSIVNISENLWMFSGALVDSASGKVERQVSFEHRGSVFLLKREPIALMADQLAGVKLPSVVAEPPPLQIPDKIEDKEKKGGFPWWAWLLIGLGVAALALGGGGGDSGGGSSGSSSSSGSSGGSVVISW